MPINIEIKARAENFHHQRERAAQLAHGHEEILYQEDIFFQAPKGRLKLRIFSQEKGQLISYHREDSFGPKASQYHIFETTKPIELRTVLSASLNILGCVRKKRFLYLTGQTRIHFDQVEELGPFIELEVVLKEGQNEKDGHDIATTLMKQLGISKESLLEKAYVDLLMGQDTKDDLNF